MAKQYRPWTPNQSWLLPPSPRDWLDKEQFVYFFFGMEVVDELDISAIEDTIQAKDARMKREEERLRAEIAAMMADAEAVDREEDAQYGADRRSWSLSSGN